jgi:hypothetical protein
LFILKKGDMMKREAICFVIGFFLGMFLFNFAITGNSVVIPVGDDVVLNDGGNSLSSSNFFSFSENYIFLVYILGIVILFVVVFLIWFFIRRNRSKKVDGFIEQEPIGLVGKDDVEEMINKAKSLVSSDKTKAQEIYNQARDLYYKKYIFKDKDKKTYNLLKEFYFNDLQ